MAQVDAELKRGYEAIQTHLATFKDLQARKTKHVETLNQLGAQRNENELVKEELVRLEPEASVFKLIGPALLSQDVEDAKQVVTRRLEHIASETRRVEGLIEDAEKKEDAEREKIIALQKQMQARQQALQQAAAAQQQQQQGK